MHIHIIEARGVVGTTTQRVCIGFFVGKVQNARTNVF